MKTGKKDNPKPLVEKVAEAKPADDAVGKISEKPPVVTDTSPPPVPKVEDKPVEKKPDPPKPVAEAKPKEEPKPVEKKPRSAQGRSDRGSHQERREEAAAEAGPGRAAEAAETEGGTNLRRVEDRGAARQARPDPGGADRRRAQFQCRAWTCPRQGRGQFRDLGFDVQGAGRTLLEEALWRHREPEPRGRVRDQAQARRYAGRLAGSGRNARDAVLRVYQESALRAIIECQPYNLPAAFFDEWKYFAPVFTERKT